MRQVDYFAIIHKYIEPGSKLYSIYLPHVVLVTSKALEVARRLKLSEEQQRFIEEAAMLHDIGICKIYSPQLGADGDLPYSQHILAGAQILEEEGLPRHARIAKNHTGVGLFADDIRERGIEIPLEDYVVETIEEKVVSWADIFFSKRLEMLWYERTIEEAREEIAQHGEQYAKIFDEWRGELDV